MMERSVYLALAFACAVASLLGLLGWRRRSAPGLRRAGVWGGRACLVAALGAWLLRWGTARHLPVFGTWESALSLATAVLLASLLAERAADPPGLWPVTTAVAAALLVQGGFYDPTLFPLTISERSWVVDVHALVAWSAFGCLAVNAAVAARRVLGRDRAEAAGDRLLTFTLGLGFVLHSAMLTSGSFYKFLLFGTAWSFDPVETLGFAAWVGYGTLLHLNRLAGWEGRRLAAWCLGLFVVLTVSYRAIVYFPAWSTYHIFDMDLRMHVTASDSSATGGEP
jgi:ABC-type transport system involved in cytochrome c biogenesis permease subunit